MASANNGGDRQMTKIKCVMGAVIASYVLVNSLANHVRGKNPQARFITAVPIMVEVALLLVNIGALSGIALGAVLVWGTKRHETGCPGRLLLYGFALNFVALAVTIVSCVLIL